MLKKSYIFLYFFQSTHTKEVFIINTKIVFKYNSLAFGLFALSHVQTHIDTHEHIKKKKKKRFLRK